MIDLMLVAALQASTWDGVREDGWTFMAEAQSRQLLYFTRPADRGARRLWIRMEYAPGHPDANGFRSTRALVVGDCQEGRLKSLQTTSFREPNLMGAKEAGNGEENWFYPAPDTLHEQVLDLICSQSPR